MDTKLGDLGPDKENFYLPALHNLCKIFGWNVSSLPTENYV